MSHDTIQDTLFRLEIEFSIAEQYWLETKFHTVNRRMKQLSDYYKSKNQKTKPLAQ